MLEALEELKRTFELITNQEQIVVIYIVIAAFSELKRAYPY